MLAGCSIIPNIFGSIAVCHFPRTIHQAISSHMAARLQDGAPVR